MIGLSVSKLLLIAGLIWLVIYFVRRGRKQRRREEQLRAQTPPGVENLTACPVCKVYLVAGANDPCGREDCPVGRRR